MAWRNALPVQATSADISTTRGSTNVSVTGPLYLLDLFSVVSVMTSGHGCAPLGDCR